MTFLPSLLQPIHSNAITQSKGQKCPSTSKKMTKSKPWHENQDITYELSLTRTKRNMDLGPQKTTNTNYFLWDINSNNCGKVLKAK